MRKKIFVLLIFLFSFTAFSGTTINESELKNKQFYLNKRIDFSAIQGNERKKLFIQTLVPIIENIEMEIKTEKEQVKKIIEKGVRTQEEKDILNNA
ncbi:MAG: BAX protein, partial [Fusobacterium ulcerans]|nr:BAX protein [Fusobacterium ulcerans]